jgi:hypothetical protein
MSGADRVRCGRVEHLAARREEAVEGADVVSVISGSACRRRAEGVDGAAGHVDHGARLHGGPHALEEILLAAATDEQLVLVECGGAAAAARGVVAKPSVSAPPVSASPSLRRPCRRRPPRRDRRRDDAGRRRGARDRGGAENVGTVLA